MTEITAGLQALEPAAAVSKPPAVATTDVAVAGACCCERVCEEDKADHQPAAFLVPMLMPMWRGKLPSDSQLFFFEVWGGVVGAQIPKNLEGDL